MSLHGAKGLEFGNVFIVGCEDGNLPHEASMDEGQLNAERPLMYVCITRAKHRLWLTHSRQRRRWGQMQSLLPRRFLTHTPAPTLPPDANHADPQTSQCPNG